MTGKLWTYLAALIEQCVERRDFLMNQIMKQEGITEKLKSRDQMEWVRQANSRKDLLDWLKALKDEKVVDIRKVYKNGVTDSVMDNYRRYLEK